MEVSELFFFDPKLAKNPLTLPPPDPDPVIDPDSDLFPSLLRLLNGFSPPKESERFLGPKSALAGAGESAGGSTVGCGGGVFILHVSRNEVVRVSLL
jgi:hypothetical protein